MYDVAHFKASDDSEVIKFMREHPFIVLCGCGADGTPVATHVPALIAIRDDKVFIAAHVMRKQKHTTAFEENPNVLAIFQGAHTYVSASWYEDKQIASTWNYQAVHAKGGLRFLDENGLHNLLVTLTATFENNPQSPSLVQHLDKNYVSAMMKAIVAFEIEVTEIGHVFKLSQNRDKKSYENIISHLNQKDPDAQQIAELMKQRKEKVFRR